MKASDLREDLPVLRLLTSQAYSGYDTAARHGWNWDRWFADWDARLAQSGDAALSLQDAFAPVGDLEKFQLDNHSGPIGTDYTSGSVSAVLRTTPHGNCTRMVMSDGSAYALSPDPGQQPHEVRQWDGTSLSTTYYVSYPHSRGTISALECANGTISASMTAQDVVKPQPPVYQRLADGIGYLRLPAFDDAADEKIRALARDLPADVGKDRVLIVDLRGNEGGSATPGILLHWGVSQQQLARGSQFRQVGARGCFRTALFFGLRQLLSARVRAPISTELRDSLQQSLDGLAGPTDGDCTPKPYATDVSWTLKEHRFAVRRAAHAGTRILALVDNNTASDGEYMTEIITSIPDSVIAGTSTYGVFGFTQPGFFVLPHTRVVYRLALSRTDAYGDSRSVDGYGMSVDVLLPTAQSQSMQSLLALAKQLQ